MIHCLFEQSGTFKNAFKKLGYKAVDYDIENQFNQTDFVIDIFDEIELAYNGKKSIFDKIKQNDLIFAFFPCTYFSVDSEMSSRLEGRKIYDINKIMLSIENNEKRFYFYKIFCEFVSIIKNKKIKTIIENPANRNFLNRYFPQVYDDIVIFKNRTFYGDKFHKPTMFMYFNHFSKFTIFNYNKIYEKQHLNNFSSIGRSLITQEFAEFFIKNFIEL